MSMLASASKRGGTATCSGRELSARLACAGPRRLPTWTSCPSSNPMPLLERCSSTVSAAKARPGGKSAPGGAPKRQAAPGNPPSAPRITGKVGRMSVNTQIQLVERYKSLSGGGTGTSGVKTALGTKGGAKTNTVEKTAFRKTKDDAYQEELARRRAAKQAEARHVETLQSREGTGAPPTLLVDGYNVCGCDEGFDAGLGLKEAFMNGDLETAQRKLVEELDALGAHTGYRIVCVFDADRTNRNFGPSGGLDRATRTKAGTWVVFSVTNDADSWIEKASLAEVAGDSSVEDVLVKTRGANPGRIMSVTERDANKEDARTSTGEVSGNLKASPRAPRAVYVATSDNALSSVVRGNGAYAISAGSLVEELVRARASETEILHEMALKARWGGTRGNAMRIKDAATAEKLLQMYRNAPNTAAVERFGSRGGGFSSTPKKGKKNKAAGKNKRDARPDDNDDADDNDDNDAADDNATAAATARAPDERFQD